MYCPRLQAGAARRVVSWLFSIRLAAITRRTGVRVPEGHRPGVESSLSTHIERRKAELVRRRRDTEVVPRRTRKGRRRARETEET